MLLMTLLTATPTIIPVSTTSNNSPALDLSISIAVIIAITALISPIFVAILNNQHQYKMKQMEYEKTKDLKELEYEENRKIKELEMQSELKKHQWDTYYDKATVVFEELANNVGTFLGDTSYLEPYSKALGSINQARIYADKELQGYLDNLLAEIVAFDEDMVSKKEANKVSAIVTLGFVIQSANRILSIKE